MQGEDGRKLKTRKKGKTESEDAEDATRAAASPNWGCSGRRRMLNETCRFCKLRVNEKKAACNGPA